MTKANVELTPPLRIHHVDRAAALRVQGHVAQTRGEIASPRSAFERLALADGALCFLELDGSTSIWRHGAAANTHRWDTANQ